MIPRINKPLLALLFFGFLTALNCPAFAQIDPANKWPYGFDQIGTFNNNEKLFVHTDKSVYLTGETIWFKIYALDATSNRPLYLSKLAYVELLDAKGKPVLQAKIVLGESGGEGSLTINSSLASGNFLLRAYTSWMKNEGESGFFEKPISIINPYKYPESIQVDTTAGYSVGFYPEGGNLVAGLKSKIGFQVTDRSGKGIAATGFILSEHNDTVAQFATQKFGLGQFQFTPVSGSPYRALVIPANGKPIAALPPAVFDKGYVLSLRDTVDRQVHLRISASKNFENQKIYLLVHKRNKLYEAMESAIQNGEAIFAIEKSKLDEGITTFTILDDAKQPVCERLYFRRPGLLQFTISSDQPHYTTRQKVTLDVDIRDSISAAEKKNLSLSVYRVDDLQPAETDDIASYIWLTSELKGAIESPSYYMSNFDPEADLATENLILTHGWRRYDWENTGQGSFAAFTFMPELAGPLVACRITHKSTGMPASQIRVFLSIPGQQFKFMSSVSDSAGRVYFDIGPFFGTQNLVIQTESPSDSMYRIDLMNSFSERSSPALLPGLRLTEQQAKDIQLHITGADIQSAYAYTKPEQFIMPLSDTTPFYGKPDNTYFLDEYTRFSTMEEVLREYVPEVQVKKTSGKFQLHVFNSNYKTLFESQPLVLLDGFPVFDIDRVLQIDPLKIKSMDVISRSYFLGTLECKGIISYRSYNGGLGGYQVPPGSIHVNFKGLELQRQFYSPAYETGAQRENRLPDFRNVLLWDPYINMEENHTATLFFASDLPGRYLVLMQGITASGLAGSAVTFLSVTEPHP